MPSKRAADRPSTASSHDGTFGTVSGSTVPCSRISGNKVGSTITLQDDRAGTVVVGDLARDHRPRPVLLHRHLAVESEPEFGIALVDADRATLQGITDKAPTIRPAGTQYQYRGQGHHRCTHTPGKAPAG